MAKKTLQQEQYEYYKRQNDVDKWTAIVLFGVPLAAVIIIGFLFLVG